MSLGQRVTEEETRPSHHSQPQVLRISVDTGQRVLIGSVFIKNTTFALQKDAICEDIESVWLRDRRQTIRG